MVGASEPCLMRVIVERAAEEGGPIWEEEGGRASGRSHDRAQLHTVALAFRI